MSRGPQQFETFDSLVHDWLDTLDRQNPRLARAVTDLAVPRVLNSHSLTILTVQSSSSGSHREALEMLGEMRLILPSPDRSLVYDSSTRNACLRYASASDSSAHLNGELANAYARLAEGSARDLSSNESVAAEPLNNTESDLIAYTSESLYHASAVSRAELCRVFEQLFLAFEHAQLPRMCEVTVEMAADHFASRTADDKHDPVVPLDFWRSRTLRLVRRAGQAVAVLDRLLSRDIPEAAKVWCLAELVACHSDLHHFDQALKAAEAAGTLMHAGAAARQTQLSSPPWWLTQMSEDQVIAENFRMLVESGDTGSWIDWLLCLRSVSARRSGRLDEARAALAEVLQSSEGLPGLRARALRQEVEVFQAPSVRALEAARASLRRAVGALGAGDARAQARLDILAGKTELLGNNLSGALNHFTKSIRVYTTTPSWFDHMSALVHHAWVQTALCLYDDARSAFDQALIQLNWRRSSRLLGTCLMGRAEVFLRTGRLREAACDFEAAITVFDSFEAWLPKSQSLRGLAEVALNSKQYGVAWKQITAAYALAKDNDSRLGQAHCLRLMAIQKLARNQRTNARLLFVQASELYDEVGDRLGSANCMLGLAQVIEDSVAALHSLDDAARIYSALGYKRSHAIAKFVRGELLRRQGKRQQANAAYREAEDEFRDIGLPSAIRWIAAPRRRATRRYEAFTVEDDEPRAYAEEYSSYPSATGEEKALIRGGFQVYTRDDELES